MALSKASADEDRTRFFRLSSIIIEVLTPMLQDLLQREIQARRIFNIVKKNTRDLRPAQIILIKKANVNGYEEFDISLLYTLLRNYCSKIESPTNGWGESNMPAQGEETEGDDIERIRIIRNNLTCHVSKPTISDNEFKKQWCIIYDICKRMQNRIPNTQFMYIQKLEETKERTTDSDMEQIYMEKMKELADDENTVKKLLLRLIEDKEPTSNENITIEAKTAQTKELVETFIDTFICTLNEMVEAIHVLTPESDIEQLYELIETFITRNKENIENKNLEDFLQGLKEKIKRHAKQQEGNRMKILAGFAKFILRIEKYYDGYVKVSKGSLILTVTFSSQKGYDLYKKDLEHGKIGQQILELILYPPFLASFDLKAEDLAVCMNGKELTQDSEDNDESIPSQSHNLEACADHPDQYYTRACQQCQLPVCVQCMETSEHKDHNFTDFAVSLRVKMAELNEKLHQGLLVKHNLWTTKEKLGSEVNEIQLRMIAKYQALQHLLDEVLKQNLEDIKRYRKTQINSIGKKFNDIDQFISDLMNNLKEISENLPAQAMLQLKSCSLKADLFESSNIIYPEFIENEPDLMNISDLFGKLKIPQMTVWESGIDLDNEDELDDGDFDVNDMEQPTVILATSFSLQIMASHVSPISSIRAWVSDFHGDLSLLDDTGNKHHQLKTLSGGSGCHTVTKEGELIFINPDKEILKISKDLEKEDLNIRLPYSMLPSCVYSSHFNADLLIGMWSKISGQGTWLRISETTKEESYPLQYDEDELLYEYPQYITENNNQDVIVCDSSKGALVVTDIWGKLRFCYMGHGNNLGFEPNGICTDSRSHILVSDLATNSVHVIDKDGDFLFTLLTSSDGAERPFCLNLKQDTLWVGIQSYPQMLVYNVQYDDQN